MLAKIKPGQWVHVTITKRPPAEAQRKTLQRLCEKDPVVRAERVRLKRARATRRHRRGGRMWADRPSRIQVVRMVPGRTYRIFATLDVLREMKSIEKHIAVAPA